MEVTYGLDEFVELCNEGKKKYVKGNRDPAFKLGQDIACLKQARDEGLNIDDVKGLEDKDSKELFKWLLKYTDENSYYTFQQNTNVVAKINAFEPFIDGVIKPEYLNQQWHVLISLLALLDMWHCNKDYEGEKKHDGKIEKIAIDVEKLVSDNNHVQYITIFFDKGGSQGYRSVAMKKWIRECVKSHI